MIYPPQPCCTQRGARSPILHDQFVAACILHEILTLPEIQQKFGESCFWSCKALHDFRDFWQVTNLSCIFGGCRWCPAYFLGVAEVVKRITLHDEKQFSRWAQCDAMISGLMVYLTQRYRKSKEASRREKAGEGTACQRERERERERHTNIGGQESETKGTHVDLPSKHHCVGQCQSMRADKPASYRSMAWSGFLSGLSLPLIWIWCL